MIETLIKDCIDICINIQRVDTGGVGDYLVEMRGDFSIRFLQSDIYLALESQGGNLRSFIDNFDEYKFYIQTEIGDFFQSFISQGHKQLLKKSSTEEISENDNQQ